jgi:hypothetical protein
MKPGSNMEPSFYLGTKLKKTIMPNSVVAWVMRSRKYVQEAVQNLQEHLKEKVNVIMDACGPWLSVVPF